MSFDEHLRDFFSTPRTIEAQLLAPKAKVIQDTCAVMIPALARALSTDCQHMISHFAGNTPANVPLWAVAVEPEFFKGARPHLEKNMWTTTVSGDGHGSGRVNLHRLHLANLTTAMWRRVIKDRVAVEHEPPPSKYPSRRTRWASYISEVNKGATAVLNRDGYWMHIQRSNATPFVEYGLDIEPNYD